ncbi:SCAN domain-containing protein 3 [Trichonephila clavata]|uniref:SCAN domain-containing protein 3 n=1 Tax=Trichonephila clavata TaxID=2740835 RepID=A0A8X6KW65_TRICU|nr:SCAN domain-containing protein 3 [Trichonephila clavata]
MQVVEKLKTRKFSVQLNESTLRDSEAVLIIYLRYVYKGNFAEEMFCKSLESTTTSKDIFNKLKTFSDSNNIPMKNITSCASDGIPIMMGKENGYLKLMKEENSNMLLVHCVIHRENLVAKYISPVVNVIFNLAIKCINATKANAKRECFFKSFWEEQNEDHIHVRLILHTDVRWQSKGIFLNRFMVLFDTLSDFFKRKT